jgi:hypothetical protein
VEDSVEVTQAEVLAVATSVAATLEEATWGVPERVLVAPALVSALEEEPPHWVAWAAVHIRVLDAAGGDVETGRVAGTDGMADGEGAAPAGGPGGRTSIPGPGSMGSSRPTGPGPRTPGGKTG